MASYDVIQEQKKAGQLNGAGGRREVEAVEEAGALCTHLDQFLLEHVVRPRRRRLHISHPGLDRILGLQKPFLCCDSRFLEPEPLGLPGLLHRDKPPAPLLAHLLDLPLRE